MFALDILTTPGTFTNMPENFSMNVYMMKYLQRKACSQ